MNILSRLKVIIIIFSVSILFSAEQEKEDGVTFDPVPVSNLHNAEFLLLPDGTTAYTVSDVTYRESRDPFLHDIVLSFNYPSGELQRDDTGKYRITEADYNFVGEKGGLGGGSANFFKSDHRVVVETGSRQWLGTCEDPGSFTIEFRINPGNPDGVVFSRIGHFSGKETGIEIRLRDYSIVTSLRGMFERPDGLRKDVTLGGEHRIPSEKWTHFALSYDRISGKLSHVVNGEEVHSRYITATGSPFEDVYPPYFAGRDKDGNLKCFDAPYAIIGGDRFWGMLDEFRISYKQFDDLEKRTAIAYRDYLKVQKAGRLPVNVEGVVTSPVYDLGHTGTKVTSFSWEQELRKDTFVWFEFRISDARFPYDDNSLKWYRVDRGQRNIYLHKDEKDEYLRGRYCQWRARLVTSPDGRKAPVLSDVNMTYRIDYPPAPPRFLEVVDASSAEVVLEWKKNVEPDLYGYKIYYGVYPGRYDGIITHIDGERITNDFSDGDSIKVAINNAVIKENRNRQTGKLLDFPPLRNTVLYYFAVSAYDSYKPDTVYNHESELPEPVSARPFPGTEIK